MAIDTSSRYEAMLKPPHLPHLHALIKASPIIRRIRALGRSIFPISYPPLDKLPALPISAAFEAGREHYQREHWVYFNDIIDSSLYPTIRAQWPPRRYHAPPIRITKGYDIGFRWVQGDPIPEDLSRFPALKGLFDYLGSESFIARLENFIGSDHPMAFKSFLITTSYPGTCVIPHRDTPLPKEAGRYINMIIFVDGTGGGDSGELMLAKDNDLNEVIFMPPTLKNACLLYDTEAPFYHGFPPIAWGKYRYTIGISFYHRDFNLSDHH